MRKQGTWRGRFAASGLLGALALSGGVVAGGCSSQSEPGELACDSARQYFAEVAWPVVIGSVCIACHNPSGIGNKSEYVLKGPAEPDFIDYNLSVIDKVAGLERDGESQFLLKPTMQIPHEGGQVLTVGSEGYKALHGLIVRLKNTEACEESTYNSFAEVELTGPVETLRKAAIILVGRLPTDEEVERVTLGGDDALSQVLDEMMTDDRFLDFVKTTYNDYLHTDFYLSQGASDVINDNVYADPYWYVTADKTLLERYGLRDSVELERYTDWSIAREPLELIAHVVRENRPFTEIVTANYIMVTPLSARTYGASGVEFNNPDNPLEFAEAKLELPGSVAFPHAGILTSPMFLSRHTTTDTNRNRHRVREVLYFALGLDVLKVAQQAVDPSLLLGATNPMRDEPACTVCHKILDPIAAGFMAWDPQGNYDPTMDWSIDGSTKWYPENFAPGYGNELMPETELARGTQWIATRLANDPRFRIGATYMMYEGLTGRRPIYPPSDFSDPTYKQQFRSFMTQADYLRSVGGDFAASGFNLKVVVKELVMSPYFRAKNALDLTPEREIELSEVGMGHILTPEQLHRKLNAVLGLPWADDPNRPHLDFRPRDPGREGDYLLFYGGQNSVSNIKRTREATGLMAGVMDRMANEMACKAVPQDFVRAPEERVLFPLVTVDDTDYDLRDLAPFTDSGLPIDKAIAAIKEGIRRLHERILGVTPSDEDVEAAYDVFVTAWKEGTDAMDPANATPLSQNLPYECQARTEFYTGIDYPDEQIIDRDDNYVLRSWMAVISYYLGDYQFLYE